MKTSQFRLTRTLWFASLLAASCTLIGSPRLLAQSQDDQSQSVAEAARKAKEQKKAAAKNNAVITDDTIHLRPASDDSGAAPPSGTVVTTGGEAGPPPAENAAKNSAESTPATTTSAGQTPASADADSKKDEKLKSDIDKLKGLLAQAQSQLDLLKRQFALDSDNFYSEPDYAHDANGKAKLEDLQHQIGDKKVSVDDLKQQLEQLLQQAGISADSDKPAPPPQS